ncbi:DUF397 domain-containing protein [Actinomadura sp. SCN-SB]|uniref:DUF397 domain-containing protein n=1 Tax=Actinomadura sp. SCN-SB TaxID=3373092 RepID=UPI003752D4BC
MTTQWRKASRSNTSGGQCVEVAELPEAIGVRDSKDPQGPKLILTPGAWRTLVDHVKSDGLAN